MTLISRFEDVPPISVSQRKLLRALLVDAPQCRDAFREWVAQVDFDGLDYASLRLVPGLFARFGDDALSEPYRARMKGIYRHFHYRASLIAADVRPAIEALMAAGIDLMVFKGLAIALKYHATLALRPMGDVDILIRREHLDTAERILAGLGWHDRYAAAKKMRGIHSYDYTNARKSGLDVHWYALYESPHPGIDEAVWARSEFIDWQGLRVRVPAREDLVFLVMINAMRAVDDMHCQWVFDVATIIGAQDGFDWNLVWNEAGRRGLRTSTFNAMLLLHEFVPQFIDGATLHALFESDDALVRETLHRLVRENRTVHLGRSHRTRVRRVLAASFTAGRNTLTRAWLERSTYRRVLEDPTAPKHIHYTMNGAGTIESLYVHRHNLRWLPRLFRNADAGLRRALSRRLLWRTESWLPVRTGALRLPERDTLPEYRARIEVPDGVEKLVIPAGMAGEIALTVCNDSSHCWFVRENSAALYGVSYHLHSPDGTLVAWDQPRTYFMAARENYLSFVAPGQKLACRMKVHAPPEPGSYRLQLDVLQETILWFSSQGISFPSIELEVVQ